MTNNDQQSQYDPAAEAAARERSEAERLEAIQWLHWATRLLDAWPQDGLWDDAAEAAMARGEAGIRPDAAALAAAEARGRESDGRSLVCQ